MVDSEGKATQTCKQTKKFYDRKRTKPTNSDVRAKIKDSWNKMKPDYDKKNRERQDSLKKLKELQEQRDKAIKEKDDKIKEANDKKKERLAKCDTPIALLIGATFSEVLSKRDGEHPYDWTTDYFDEEFVASDERLKDWPQDIDVEQISADVDTDAFLKKWDQYIDDHKREPHSCQFIGKRSLERRCSQKRSFEEWYGDDEPATRFNNASSLVQRHIGPVFHADASARDITITPSGMHELEKRNPLALLFEILAQFGTRLAVQLTARATATVAANSPRLANLLKTPERLFQTAAKGQGTKAGQKGMDGAKEAIKKDAKRYWKCLKEGKP
jgi:membrane-associated HD superfamily phosphohydrolase